MRILQTLCLIAVVTVLSQPLAAQHEHHTGSEAEEPKSEKSNLVDEFGRLGHCDLTARFDFLFQELSNNLTRHGYVIFYKGAGALPGQLDNASYERTFRAHLAMRGFDPARVTVIDGGFREEIHTQLWIVAPGEPAPEPTETVPPPKTPGDKTLLFDHTYIADETFDSEEFELPSVKAERAAEEAKYLAEAAAEEGRDPGNAGVEEVAEETPGPPEPESEEYVDDRTPEEIENARFHWLSEKFVPFVAKHKKSRGVIIFYADDQTYDIALVRKLIEQGRKRMADAAKIAVDDISIEFGGYRSSIDAEFWFVPEKGKAPEPKPEERPVEEPAEEAVEEPEGQDG